MSNSTEMGVKPFLLSAGFYLLLAGATSILLFVLPAVSAVALKVVAIIFVTVVVICLLALYFWLLSQSRKDSDFKPGLPQALRRSAEVLLIATVILTALSALVALICVLIYYSLQNLFTVGTLKIIIDSLIVISVIAAMPFLLNLLGVFAMSAADLKGRLAASIRIGTTRYLLLLALCVGFALVLGIVLWLQGQLSVALVPQIIGALLLAAAFGLLLSAAFWVSVQFAPPPPKVKSAAPSTASLQEGGQLS